MYFIFGSILLSLFSICASIPKCDPTMEFNECGPGCPAKCSDVPNKAKNCTEKCKFGCHCKSGLVLDHYDNCVAPHDCPIFVDEGCGLNTVYSSCATACPARCFKRPPKPNTCRKKCKKGCTCEKGFVLDPHNNCVLPSKCKKKGETDG